MASIRKRGSRWQVQIRRQGQATLSKTFGLRADAERWARDQDRAADRGELSGLNSSPGRHTVQDMLRRYCDEVVTRKRGGDVETYVINAMLKQPFCSIQLGEARPSIFAAYRDRRLERVSGVTIHRELGLIQHAFDIARTEWGWCCGDNPLKAVRRPPGGKPRDRRLESNELEALMAATEQSRNPNLRPLILFAIETGMRLGELLSLRWQDVDLGKSLALLHHTKNGWPRTVPLSSRAVEILGKMPRGERVFATSSSAVV